jgi:hypothetical protein
MDVSSLGIVFQATLLGCFLKGCSMMNTIIVKQNLLRDAIFLDEADLLASSCISLAFDEIANEFVSRISDDNSNPSVVEEENLDGFQPLIQSGKKKWFAFGNQYSRVPTSDPSDDKIGCRLPKIKWPWRRKL